MSFKGEIEAGCPKGCEPFTTEVWSFIRGDQSPDLRLAVKFRECNLLLCPSCNTPFVAEAPVIYFEPEAELLAFVFPESYRAKEAYWREKMHADFVVFKQSLGREVPLAVEPELFFGGEGLAKLLEDEDYRSEEREVMECLAAELGLSLYRVSPSYARQNKIPRSLPYVEKGRAPVTRKRVVEGLEKLLLANDRLTFYADYLDTLRASPNGALPPPAQVQAG